jgi:hypothetical protein
MELREVDQGRRRPWRAARIAVGVVALVAWASSAVTGPAPAQPATTAYGGSPPLIVPGTLFGPTTTEPAVTTTTAAPTTTAAAAPATTTPTTTAPPSTAQVLGVQITAAPAAATPLATSDVGAVAFTGFTGAALLRLGGAAVVLGALLVVIARRRRSAPGS